MEAADLWFAIQKQYRGRILLVCNVNNNLNN